MAYDKLVDASQLNSDLGDVADAIRAKSGGSSQLAFPSGFISEIGNISTGGGGGQIHTMSPTATANRFPEAAQAIRDGAYSIIGNNKAFIAVWYSGDKINNYISVMMDIPPSYGGGTGKGQTLVARNGDRRFARMLDYDQVSASFDYFCSASSVYQVIDLADLYGGIIT